VAEAFGTLRYRELAGFVLYSLRTSMTMAAPSAVFLDPADWWADVLARDRDEVGEGEEPATADAEGLRRFLEDDV
jgi:hypothetical protein